MSVSTAIKSINKKKFKKSNNFWLFVAENKRNKYNFLSISATEALITKVIRVPLNIY